MKKNQGFTLIEVAIVMLIGGLLLAMAATLLLTYTKKVQLGTTERRLALIDESLQLFLNLNGRYPCPAPLGAPIDDMGGTFGFEEFAAGCTGPVTGTAGRDGRAVRIGAVPVRTLGLPDDFIADAWGGRFTYAVTDILTDPGTYNRNEGGIAIIDSQGNDVVTDGGTPAIPGVAHYVVVSHGGNNSGATPTAAGGVVPCTVGTLEEENCDDDATFRSTILVGTGNAAAYYDDLISFRAVTAFGEQVPEGAVLPFNLNACPPGWTEFNSAGGRYVVGAVAPTYTVGDMGGTDNTALAESESPYEVYPQQVNPAPIETGGAGGFYMAVRRPAGAADGHENRPPYIALLFCEKT